MAKKKRVIRKPVSTSMVIIRADEELPSILEESTKQIIGEEFYDSIDILENEIRLEIESGNIVRFPKMVSWAEEVDKKIINQMRVNCGANSRLIRGVEKIVRMHLGFTLVKLRDEVTRDIVLEAGVIHFDKKPVILRHLTAEMDSTQLVNSVLVWIRLNGLGLQYWGKKNLNALVSTIGKPIMIDKVTQERSMVKFARVLVDMEISEEPPKIISFNNERKQLVEQQVEYEWIPSKCSACENLGHIVANCNKERPVVWKRKQPRDNKAKQEKKKEQQNHDAGIVIEKNFPGDTGASTEALEGKLDQEEVNSALEKPDGRDSGNSNTWITLKRRGQKMNLNSKVEAPKTVSNNGYVALQGVVDEVPDRIKDWLGQIHWPTSLSDLTSAWSPKSGDQCCDCSNFVSDLKK
uniref:DUF4283 domain-containing protein n=1 Tax=Cannabis sativa TaxID=3483 RepID=A0A803PQM0_CANSA